MPDTALPELEPVVPTDHDRPLARESSSRLARFAQHDLQVRVAGSEEAITLPGAAVRLLVDLLAQMAQGNSVTLVPYHAELTTQQAADFLGVSRPYLIKVLEQGALPYRMVGTHRRILFKDLVAHKHAVRAKSLKALDDLAAETQRLGLGY